MEYIIIIICVAAIYTFGYFWATKDERKKKKNDENN